MYMYTDRPVSCNIRSPRTIKRLLCYVTTRMHAYVVYTTDWEVRQILAYGSIRNINIFYCMYSEGAVIKHIEYCMVYKINNDISMLHF